MDRRLGATFLVGAAERFTVNGDDVGTEFRQRCDPGDEATLERLRVEGCEQIAELIVARRALLERPEAAQEIELLLAERGDLDPAVGSRQDGQQALQQHLIQGISDFAALARVLKVFEMLKPLNNLIKGLRSLGLGVGHGGPHRESKGPP